mgnify:CR=1 FL=1
MFTTESLVLRWGFCQGFRDGFASDVTRVTREKNVSSHSDGLRRLRNFINGEFVDSVDGRTAPIVNPATGEAYAEAPVSTAEDVAERSVRASRHA